MLDSIKLTPIKVAFKAVAGFTGGLFGTLMLLLILALSSSTMTGIFGAEELATQTINPIFLAVFLIMIVTGLLVANLFSTLLVSFSDKDKYYRRASIMHQVFIYNIVLFVIALPFYIFSLLMTFGMLSIITLLHSFLSLAGSHMILEGTANPRYHLLSVYSTGLGLFLGTIINLFVFRITGTVNVLLFAFLPVTWLLMGLSHSLFEALYVSFYTLYGIDFLKTDTNFGADMNTNSTKRKTEDEEIIEEVERDLKKAKEPKDTDGAEFLKSKK